MPQKKTTINLIGDEEMEFTPIGRIITWAVTYGRYIMIGTEIIVLLAFISRFSLDRKLTDLKEEVEQKMAIIEANADFEKDFRALQAQLGRIKPLLTNPTTAADTLIAIQQLLPSDVRLQNLEITTTKASAGVVAGTTQGFSQFIANLQRSTLFKQIEIGEVRRTPFSGIQFSFTANIAAGKK